MIDITATPATDDVGTGSLPDVGTGHGKDILRQALEHSGVRAEKLDQLVDAIETWKKSDGKDTSGLEACIEGYEDGKPTEEKEPPKDKPADDGGNPFASKEEKAVKKARKSFGFNDEY